MSLPTEDLLWVRFFERAPPWKIIWMGLLSDKTHCRTRLIFGRLFRRRSLGEDSLERKIVSEQKIKIMNRWSRNCGMKKICFVSTILEIFWSFTYFPIEAIPIGLKHWNFFRSLVQIQPFSKKNQAQYFPGMLSYKWAGTVNYESISYEQEPCTVIWLGYATAVNIGNFRDKILRISVTIPRGCNKTSPR